MTVASNKAIRMIERVDASRELLDVLAEIQSALQVAAPFDGCFVGAADPETTLATSSALIGALPDWTCTPFWDGEFLVDDYSKFVDLHRAGGKAVTMDRATGGRRTRSHRHNTINAVLGFGPELRATLATAAPVGGCSTCCGRRVGPTSRTRSCVSSTLCLRSSPQRSGSP